MVAQKRGRGARNQAAKGKTQAEEQQQPMAEEVADNAEGAGDENNGDTEPMEQGEESHGAGDGDAPADGQDAAEGPEDNEQHDDAEDKKEDKVESGKVLVENLPSSCLFDYQDKLKELFSKHGEVINVKRGPIIVTELTTTPTLSAIVEFKNKESLDKALSEHGALVDGSAISVAVESRAETAVLVGVPYEASSEYVRRLFNQCGDIAHIHEFSKTKYKILRVTFHGKEAVEKALKLDRELRINGFLVTVSKYRDDDEQKAHNANAKNKRQQAQQQNRNSNSTTSPNGNRNNSYRPRGGAAFNARGNFRGGRGRGAFGGRGGSFPRGGFAPLNTYMPPQPFMGRPGSFMDGQRPNKRLRQM